MSATKGSFSLPMPSKTSQLVNDARFLSIQEYVLNTSNLSGTTQVSITDLPVGSIITKVELRVTTAFAPTSTQHNIAINGASSEVLMDSGWNDPNTIGNYSTEAYYAITSSGIRVVHNCGSVTAGSAILRLYIYSVTE